MCLHLHPMSIATHFVYAHVSLLFQNLLVILEPYPVLLIWKRNVSSPIQLWASYLEGTSAEQQIHFPAPGQDELSSSHPWQMFVPFRDYQRQGLYRIPGALLSSSLESFSWYLFWVFPAAIYSYFYSPYELWKQRTDYRLSKWLFNVIQNLSSPLNFLFSQLNHPKLFRLCLQVMFRRHLIFLLCFGLSPIALPVPWSVH